jgi:galactonate dehydratase
MYVDQLITKPMKVEGGYVKVPEAPGLGIEFNEAALKWRVNSPDKAQADAIYAIVRPTGQKLWYPTEFGQYGYWTENWAGNVPLFDRGVRLEAWANDGSKEWREMKERLRSGPVWAS